jgi:4-amino-4-deoxy-L-arabinose transferase-like glycosyltransferase
MFYLGPALAAYIAASIIFCRWRGLRAWLLAPILSVVGFVLYFVYYSYFTTLTPNFVVTIFAAVFVVGLMVFLVELAATVGRFRLVSVLVFIIVTGLIMGVLSGIGKLHSSQLASWQVRSYRVINFPVYYVADGPDPSAVVAKLGKDPDSHAYSIDFISRAFGQFGEMKYPGMPPSSHCGGFYGGEQASHAAIVHCNAVHQGAHYTLYREEKKYAPEVAEPIVWHYFAIFRDQTVVWYGGSDLPWNAKDVALKDVVTFYDSLVPVSLQSPRMVQILGNQDL